MEQYELPRRSFLKNIRKALKHVKPEAIFIRFVGSRGGGVMVNEDLTNKTLSLFRAKDGLKILIDGKEGFFHYAHSSYPNPQEPYTGPEDPALPPVRKSILRSVNREYLIERVEYASYLNLSALAPYF